MATTKNNPNAQGLPEVKLTFPVTMGSRKVKWNIVLFIHVTQSGRVELRCHCNGKEISQEYKSDLLNDAINSDEQLMENLLKFCKANGVEEEPFKGKRFHIYHSMFSGFGATSNRVHIKY